MNRLQWAILLTGGGVVMLMTAAVGTPTEIDCVGNCENNVAEFIGELALAIFLGGVGSVAFLIGAILFLVEWTKSKPDDTSH